MIICENCGNTIEDDVDFCYFCGEECAATENFPHIDSYEENSQNIVCPICHKSIEKGIIEVNNYSSLLNINTFVTFYDENEAKKLFKKNGVSLSLKAEGYYCQHCEKFIGIFERR